MLTVDVRGMSCPLPVMKTRQALAKSPSEAVEVLADSGTARANVVALLAEEGYDVSVEERDAGVYGIMAKR